MRQNRIELEAEFVLSLDDVLAPDQMIRLGVFKQRMMEMRKCEMERKKKPEKDRKHVADFKRARNEKITTNFFFLF